MSTIDGPEGWKNPGESLLVLVAEGNHYIVYLDRDMSVEWATSPEFASDAAKQAPYDAATLADLLQQVERLDAQHAEALAPATTRRFKEHLAQAVARAMAHDYEGARELLGDAGHFVPASQDSSDYREQWKDVLDGEDFQDYVVVAKDYIVYVNTDDDVVWQTTAAYDRDLPKRPNFDPAAQNSILNQVEVMSATPSEGFSKETILRFKNLLGAATACALDIDYESARQMLADARKYIRARSEETSRFWYLSASLVAALVVALIGGVIWLKREQAIVVLGPTAFWIALGAVAGAVGALLSVIWRSGELKFDSTSGRLLHYLEGGSRIAAGAISGILASLAVKSGLILGTLTDRADRANIILLLAAMAAGWGERLATSIISTFETTQVKGAAGGDDTNGDGNGATGGEKKNPPSAPRAPDQAGKGKEPPPQTPGA